MRRWLISLSEVVFLTATALAIAGLAMARFGIESADPATAGMVLLVWLAFAFFTASGHFFTSHLGGRVENAREALVDHASRRSVVMGGVPHLPPDAAEAVITELDAEAPPSWFGLGQNVLVSLGLVGTFFGLTLGIYKAAPQFDLGTEVAMKGAMSALMGGAKLAFAKSLVGVVAALIWSFRNGIVEDEWARQRTEARRWLDERFPVLTSERLLAQLVTEVQGLGVQQQAHHEVLSQRVLDVELALRPPDGDDVVTALDSLKHTASQLADALPERIGGPVSNGMTRALESALTPSLDQVAKGIHALTAARGGIEDRVGEQVSGQVTELGGSLRSLQDAVTVLKDQLVALPTQVETEVRSGTRTATESLSRDLAEAGDRVAESVSVAASQLADGGESIAGSVGELRAALADGVRVADALRNAGSATAASLVGVQAPLDNAAAQILAANAALRVSSEQVTVATTALRGTTTVIAEAEPALRSAWREERLAAERLLASTQAAQQPVDALVGRLEALQGACGELVTLVRGSGVEQRAATDASAAKLAETIARFEVGLKGIAQGLDAQSGTLFRDAADRATASAETVARALAGGAERFDSSMARMAERGESLEGLFARLESLGAALEEHHRRLESGLGAAAAPLDRAAASLTAAAPALEAARVDLQKEREDVRALFTAVHGSASSVQGVLSETNRVRKELDEEIPRRLQAIEQARRELEQSWAQAAGAREQAWALSAQRLATHVAALKQASDHLAMSWQGAEQARTAALEQNAREIAHYAQAVNDAVRLPQRVRQLDETIESLVDVLDGLRTAPRDPA